MLKCSIYKIYIISKIFGDFCSIWRKTLIFRVLQKISKKNTQPKFSEICDFEKISFFYTQIVCSNFLSYACIGLIFVSYERRRAIFNKKLEF